MTCISCVFWNISVSIPLSHCDAANEKVIEFRKAVNTAIENKSEAEKYSKKVIEKAKELEERLLPDVGFTRNNI